MTLHNWQRLIQLLVVEVVVAESIGTLRIQLRKLEQLDFK
jgi:hypothetical protein